MILDADILELADTVAHQALSFVRSTTGDPCLESVSQWSSLTRAIAEPIQRLRNHAADKNRIMTEEMRTACEEMQRNGETFPCQHCTGDDSPPKP